MPVCSHGNESFVSEYSDVQNFLLSTIKSEDPDYVIAGGGFNTCFQRKAENTDLLTRFMEREELKSDFTLTYLL